MFGRKLLCSCLQVIRAICPFHKLSKKLRCWAKMKAEPSNHLYVSWRGKLTDCHFLWLSSHFKADFSHDCKNAIIILGVPADAHPKKYLKKAFPDINIDIRSGGRIEIAETSHGFPKDSIIDCSEGACIKVGRNFSGWCATQNDIGTRLAAKKSISIGDNCMFSRGISVKDNDGHDILDMATGKLINPPEPVFIGDNVWLAENVSVLKGAHIASDCICGANALVNKKFMEPNCILAGVPAKVIKTGVTWQR